MKYHSEATLKDGRVCCIRSGSAEDARAVLDNFNQTHGETDYLLTYPDENSITVEEEREYLVKKEASENEVEIIAVVDGAVVGTAGIDSLGSKYKLRHRGEFGISVAKDYWGLGIGRLLTAACIECARTAGYTQVELDAVAANERAISLYRSFGFVEYGRNPRGMNSRTTGYQEVVYMRLEL